MRNRGLTGFKTANASRIRFSTYRRAWGTFTWWMKTGTATNLSIVIRESGGRCIDVIATIITGDAMKDFDEVAFHTLLLNDEVEPATAYMASVEDEPAPAREPSKWRLLLAVVVGLLIVVWLFS